MGMGAGWDENGVAQGRAGGVANGGELGTRKGGSVSKTFDSVCASPIMLKEQAVASTSH